MAEKYNTILRLAEETEKNVISSREEWFRFLNSAGRFCKYPFQEQLLIHAQRPGASACAPITVWDSMGCWIRRGAKGIALIDTAATRPKLKYVFDVADVTPEKEKNGRLPYLWSVKPEHEQAVMDALEAVYGKTDAQYPFKDRVAELLIESLTSHYMDMAWKVAPHVKGSRLQGMDGRKFAIEVFDTVLTSAYCMVVSACGVGHGPEEYLFPYIGKFNTHESICILGDTANAIVRPVILEIGRAVREYEKQKAAEKSRQGHGEEKNTPQGQKSLAITSEREYNALKRESKLQDKEKEKTDKERGAVNGTDIQMGRGLPDTGHRDGRTAGRGAAEVRPAAEKIPDGEQRSDVLDTPAQKRTDGPPVRDPGAGGGTDGADRRPDGGGHGSGRGAQGAGPDALGAQNEQHQALSGRNRAGGDDLHLEENVAQPKTKEKEPDNGASPLSGSFSREKQADTGGTYEQLDLFTMFAGQADGSGIHSQDGRFTFSAYKMPQDQIDDILRSGGGRDDSRKRIYAKYQQGKTPEEMAAFLRLEYGNTGKGFLFDGKQVSVWFDADGMRAGHGMSAREHTVLSMDWREIEQNIRSQVENGTYMDATEVFLVDESERSRIARHLFFFFRDGMEELPEGLGLKTSNYPDSHARLVELLSTPEGTALMAGHMDAALRQLETGEKKQHWRLAVPKETLRAELDNLMVEKRVFPVAGSVTVRREDFITQDEIDGHLSYGSGFVDGKFRIYDYYRQGHNARDAATFLKKEYGTGGGSHALAGNDNSWKDYSGKGMKLSKGNLSEPYAEVFMSWATVEKNIRRLVREDRYLSPSDKGAYAAYREAQEQEALEKQQAEAERGLRMACRDAIGHTIAGTPAGMPFTEGDAAEIIKEYGTERTVYVLANSAAHLRRDGHPCPENGEWADQIMPYALNESRDLAVQCSPDLLDAFISHVRDYINKENEKAVPEDIVDMPGQDAAAEIQHEMPVGRGPQPEHEMAAGQSEHEMPAGQEHQPEHGMPAGREDQKEHETPTSQAEPGHGMPTGQEGQLGQEMPVNRETQIEREPDAEPQILPEQDTDRHGEKVLPEPVSDSFFSDAGMGPLERENLESKLVEQTETTDFSMVKAENFHITDDALGTGGRKEKFRRNVEAVRTLEKIESGNRPATPEEQNALSQYAGWGGLADAFDERKNAWTNEYRELKNLLSPDEYASARESTLNAYYTSPVVIRSIYSVLERMGFAKGAILEPSLGTGNFFGMLPDSMRESRLYGVELDSISGRIARQLYPGADIKISGFEKTAYPNDFFDIAIGNVPFGQYRVPDRQYDKLGFPVHEYFFAKALDKVRPGGVVAFVTSRWVMDKKTPETRRYLAQRAELLGAVRLPNNAFKDNAGTEVTADILFFQKLDRMAVREPEWVYLSQNADGIAMNQYFIDHPEMVVGRMAEVSGPYGMEITCQPDTSRPFEEQLKDAVSHISGSISTLEFSGMEAAVAGIPADPDVKNFSYTVVDGSVYYRENSIMLPADVPETTEKRIKGMVQIRDCTQELIRLQMEECPDSIIKEKQAELNTLYDAFTKTFGLLSSTGNKRAFSQDASYCLLCSLEKLDDEGNFKGKADMFTKRTIKRAEPVTSVDTAAEALAVSLSEKAKVDLEYMAALAGKDISAVTGELSGIIFKNPVTEDWETADEYLSGNVRAKLETARVYAESHPEYEVNVQALRQVQPKDLEAGEIDVRIGATWIDAKYIDVFMRDVLQTPQFMLDQGRIGTQYSKVSGKWNIKGKNEDRGNTLSGMTYGTGRANAYKILEDSLNLKDVRIYDITTDEEGREKRVLNKKETMLASQKQEALREAFRTWVFEEPGRRQELCAKYNQMFNSVRPREYDGSHLKFPGMTPDIELQPHQLNAVAHQLYGANTLLAHCVGAGKTFEMIAAAMEARRLGLSRKCMFVVPNHLTDQWAADFLRLYPGANILAATKKDFEPANRKKFCSRIATGEYDAVIIGHSQFEKIPLSAERQAMIIERQIDEIEAAIAEAKAEKGERYTIKQMEATKKSLYARLERLNDAERKDNVVTFEQLGVDRLFVDESHSFKNCAKRCRIRQD